jgi:RNA polymerase sigma factor (sigma-70 family)
MPRLSKNDPIYATRQSLIGRLSNLDDQRRWHEFFETYWLLIHRSAIRAGLREDEAEEVVQETCISVAKNIERYDPKLGRFKGWLLTLTQWRVNDQFRRRGDPRRMQSRDDSRISHELGAELASPAFEKVWEEEWEKHVLDAALAKLKRKVDEKHFQIFDCVLKKGWDAAKVSKYLGVTVAQVYTVTHRLKALLAEEIDRIGS